jgi:endogenous inhibitor of DNA gyrase (YacG/DUF329 family)
VTCKTCGAAVETPEAETCSNRCRLDLEKRRIAWDREARNVGRNGYYDRRYQELVRRNEKHGAKVILAEWEAAKGRLGERP